MNPDLEALIKAYDATLEASGAELRQRCALFESRLDDAAEKTAVSKQTLLELVKLAHRKWIAASKRVPTVPPKA